MAAAVEPPIDVVAASGSPPKPALIRVTSDHIREVCGLVAGARIEILWTIEDDDGAEREVWWPATLADGAPRGTVTIDNSAHDDADSDEGDAPAPPAGDGAADEPAAKRAKRDAADGADGDDGADGADGAAAAAADAAAADAPHPLVGRCFRHFGNAWRVEAVAFDAEHGCDVAFYSSRDAHPDGVGGDRARCEYSSLREVARWVARGANGGGADGGGEGEGEGDDDDGPAGAPDDARVIVKRKQPRCDYPKKR